MEDYSVFAFPANEQQALAMLYMKGQDVSGMTPEEMVDVYLDALNRISDRFSEKYFESKDFID